MSQPALFLGARCPPNIEAYLDSLLYRTPSTTTFELVVVNEPDLPNWLTDHPRVSVTGYSAPHVTGAGRIPATARVVRRYLRDRSPLELRQITQPRWHAPGVILGATGTDTDVCTRASESLFAEYREAPVPVRAWLANNLLGRSIFLADRLFTPAYGGVTCPWWAPASLVVEERRVNADRFTSDVAPRAGLFERSQNCVLTVGRVSRRKGIDLLLAVAQLCNTCEFTVVGPVGDEALAAKLDASANVRHHPPVDYVEMPALYTAADLVLSVSRLEWGGVSRAMLEAKAAGRPVIALDKGQADQVADTVVPDSPRAIATAVTAHLK
jgi:glycosyltransferase involved in cell wall biosynthesis